MKNLNEYIQEAIKINKENKIKSNIFPTDKIKISGDIEISNDANCKGLSKAYLDAIIYAFLKSPLKNKLHVLSIKTTNAVDFFKNEGKNEFNILNKTYLYNKQYPVLMIEVDRGLTNRMRNETLLKYLPYVPGQLIFMDSKGLFHDKNTSNVTGFKDYEIAVCGPLRENNKKYFAVIFMIKPNATAKLLSPIKIYNNLLAYFKMSDDDKMIHITNISKDFYDDSTRKSAEEERENYKKSWEDDEQLEMWKMHDDYVNKLKQRLNIK